MKTSEMSSNQTTVIQSQVGTVQGTNACRSACPVCGGPLMEIRAKLQCSQCHTICETCCEGGRG